MLKNFAWLFCFNASTISCFELTLEDPLIPLIIGFFDKKFEQVDNFSEVQTALFRVFTQIKWTFVVSINHFSFINYSTNQNKTTDCLCDSSIRYYLNAPIFYSRRMFGMQKPKRYRTNVWTLIVLNCWKIVLESFVSTHQHFQILNWQLGICQFNWFFGSFDKNFELVGEFSELQTALFLVFTQIKSTFVVSVIYFSFIN